MTNDQRLLIYIGTAWGVLYVTGCFIAGIALHDVAAMRLSLACAAFCYLTNLTQFIDGGGYYIVLRLAAIGCFILSIMFGLSAGISLLAV